MRDAQGIAGRVALVKTRHAERDREYDQLNAIRRGDYDAVAPGLFNSKEFDKPLIANLVDTTARDIAEVMAPLPAVSCSSAALASDAEGRRQDLREAIANGYIQGSRLQDQMFGGADRYGSYGYMAYVVEPDYERQMPTIRVDDARAYFCQDYMGRVREYFTTAKVPLESICDQFPGAGEDYKARHRQRFPFGVVPADHKVEVVRWYDDKQQALVLLDETPEVLISIPNAIGRCPVRVVERPKLDLSSPSKGQFDDVIWVQIARAVVQMYTLNAIEQSVNAPITLPDDVDELELGPFAAIRTNTPNAVSRVNLGFPAGLFPEQGVLAQEQRVGSRYPEGRSGSLDASIITGQGVQALMGTFDTQVQTFQRLNASALEDVVAMCFEMDEALWPLAKKTQRIKDNGAPREYTYTPSKDIAGNHLVDVTYGAIAGLDPNRGLVFLLQALAGGLIAKKTARKSLPVDLNVDAEEKQIQLENLEDSMAAALAALPQAIPMMASAGADPRAIVEQTVAVRKLVLKGKSVAEAMEEVFAPKEAPPEPVSPLEQAMGGGAGPEAMPGAGSGGASDMLMSLAGMTPSGRPNLQANVSRMRPVA